MRIILKKKVVMSRILAKLQKDGAIGEKFNHRGFIFIFLRVLCGESVVWF